MQVNFFATTEDWVTLWSWIMEIPGIRVLEAHSRPDLKNREFPTIDIIAAAIREGDYCMAAWPSSVGGEPRIERIVFEPDTARRLQAKGRWTLHSPAMVTFMQHGEQASGCISPGYFSHWSEVSARQRSVYSGEFLDEVDWKQLASIARKLSGRIRKSSPAKLGGASVLPDAWRLVEASQAKLWGWGEEIDKTSPHLTVRR